MTGLQSQACMISGHERLAELRNDPPYRPLQHVVSVKERAHKLADGVLEYELDGLETAHHSVLPILLTCPDEGHLGRVRHVPWELARY